MDRENSHHPHNSKELHQLLADRELAVEVDRSWQSIDLFV